MLGIASLHKAADYIGLRPMWGVLLNEIEDEDARRKAKKDLVKVGSAKYIIGLLYRF